MTGLKCTTCNCEFNRNCHCNAGVINVSKTGVCATKEKRKNGILEQTKINIEAAKDFDFDKNPELLIQCDCKNCCHNRNGMCASEVVNVKDGWMKTKCWTKNIK